jgi:glycosyltransferase involved in cell wall biosynthesis
MFAPLPGDVARELRQQWGAPDKFVVSYIGTMGNAHGLETLLDAAAGLQHENPDVLFLLIGEGAEKQRIADLAESAALQNVRILDQQPREKIPAFISASDACLVLLKKTDVFKTVIPTKMLEFMSCASPVILGVEGQARQILEEAGGGIAIEPESSRALISSIRQLHNNPEVGHSMGQKGREYIVRNFSRAQTAENYISVLEDLKRKTRTG